MRVAVEKMQTLKQDGIKRTVISEILAALCGFLLSRTVVFDSFMPFGYAFVSSLSLYQIFAGLFGTVIGGIIPANGGFNTYYIGICVLAAAIKFISLNIYEKKNSLFFSCMTCLICSIFGCVSLLISVSLTGEDYIRMVGEALLSLSASYFFAYALPVLNSSKPLSRMSSVRACSVIMSVAILLMSLNDFTVLSASPSRIFSVFIILLAARFGQLNTSVICAVSLGFAMSFTGENQYYLIGAYALGGMISGILGSLGKIPCIIGFILGATCVMMGFYGVYPLAVSYAEIIVGSMIFFAVPKSMNKFFIDMFVAPPTLPRGDSMRKNIIQRLKFASNAMNEVSSTVDEIGKKLDKREKPSLEKVFDEVKDKCCTDCGLRFYCHTSRKKDTYKAFYDITRSIKSIGILTDSAVPENFSKRCLKPKAVSKELYEKFLIYESNLRANERISQIRGVISNQMDGLSDMLYDLAIEFNEAERFDTETASRIATLLRSLGICATDVSCKYDVNRNLSVEITAKRQKDSVPKLELVNRLSSLCGVRFDNPCITNSTDTTMINLTEKKNYRIDFGVCQINCNGEKMSGDTYTAFLDGKGKYIMILSDGMGSGPRATVDSTFAANLMEKLIKAGFGFECALKIVNSAMIFKSGDESTATIDISTIDLYSGQVDFYKAGAAETFVVKGKKVGVASCNAYPTGILEDVKFDKSTTYLQKGNVVIMCSDGVSEEDEKWIESEIISCRRSTAQCIADKLATGAKTHREKIHSDDITVMVAVIEEEY